MKNCNSLQSLTHASHPLLKSQLSTFGTRIFIACSNKPSTNWYPHTPGPMFLTRILILLSNPRARLLSGLFAPGFPAKWVSISDRPIACYMPCLLVHNFITLIVYGKEHKQLMSSFAIFSSLFYLLLGTFSRLFCVIVCQSPGQQTTFRDHITQYKKLYFFQVFLKARFHPTTTAAASNHLYKHIGAPCRILIFAKNLQYLEQAAD